MKVLGEHNAYRFEERSGDGFLFATAITKGIQVQAKGYGRTGSGHITFGFSPEEASQIQVVSDGLLPLVPTIERARSMHEADQARRAQIRAEDFPELGPYEPKPFGANAPVVHAIQFEEGSDKVASLVGGELETDELVVVGGLSWARDQLVMRIDEVDTLVFRPEAFGELAVIGANQPDFPPETSIWSRLGSK